MPDPVYISKITLPSGSTYEIKDAKAWSDIEDLRNAISGGVSFIGVTTTEISDGSTTNPITINNKSVTAIKGNLVIYDEGEFLWDGAQWVAMGDLSALGTLAYKNSASGTFTPAGTITNTNFSGKSLTSTGSFTPSGTIAPTLSASTTTSTGAVTFVTSLGTKSFSGTEATIKPKVTAAGTVAISTSSTGTANYTPAGTVSASFSGTSFNSTGSYTPSGTVTIGTGSGTANYTPAGTITVSAAGGTTTVNSITAVGTLPEFTATVANENLTLGFSQGTLPTKGENTTVKTGDATYKFSGTGAQLTGTFTGSAKTVTVSGTPTGTITNASFEGTGAVLKATFTGSEVEGTATYTPAGTVTVGANTRYLTASGTFTGSAGTVSVSGTPSGTVSASFNGTAGTVTVS